MSKITMKGMGDPPEIGLTEGLDFSAYKRLNALNNSKLSLMKRSPLHCYSDATSDDRPATPALILGSAVHTAILEPELFDEQFAVAPVGINKRTKLGKLEWDAFQKEAGTRRVLTPEQMIQVQYMTESVTGHMQWKTYNGGLKQRRIAESTVVWEDPVTGLICKARPDLLIQDGDSGHITCIDLKTTEDASAFRSSVYRYGYHRQEVFYRMGMGKLGEEINRFLFCVVEKTKPYACVFYELGHSTIKKGYEEVIDLMESYERCCTADEWGGVEEVQPLEVFKSKSSIARDAIVGIKEACEMLDCSQWTVRRMVKITKVLPAVKINNRWKFKVADISAIKQGQVA